MITIRPAIFVIPVIFLFSCSQNESQIKEKIHFVELASAKVESIPVYIDTFGNLIGDQTVEIRPQVGGIITKVFFEDGDFVKKGDPLYQIDPRSYLASLEEAEGTLIKDQAALEMAQLTVESYKPLFEKEFVSSLAFSQYLSNYEQAKGQVMLDDAAKKIAALNLEWSLISAPLSGKLSQNNLDEGNLVTSDDSTVLTTLNVMDPLQVEFYINQNDFIKIQKAFNDKTVRLEIFLPQEPLNKRAGDIFFIDNNLSQTTGTVLIKGRIQNQDLAFWPGEFVNVRITLRVEKEAILVPKQSLRLGQDGYYLFIYNPKEDTVNRRKVEKGEEFEAFVQIKEGIKENEKVVIKGQLQLKDGSKVKVVQ